MVLVAPFYLGFVLAVFEIGFLLIAGIGTRYAAHAAARSAAVWADSGPAAEAGLRPRQAAWAALAPYVGGSPRELAAAGPVPPGAEDSAPGYAAAVRRYAAGRASGTDAAARRFLNAAARTTVTVEPVPASGPRPPVRVSVTYRAPLTWPVVSRFLDPDRSPPFEYPITAVATLPVEAPETGGRGLGIGYTPVRPVP
jgi:Flp pilus assembly protein TadG